MKNKKFGIGKVLDIYGGTKNPKAKVFFVESGQKDITLTLPALELLDEEELESFYDTPECLLLENIHDGNDYSVYRNISEAVIGFKKQLNTDDFNGEFYLKDEAKELKKQ